MQIFRILLFIPLLFISSPVQAAEVAGVTVPDSIELEGKTLQLNGAGIRTKFFMDIYVCALYLEQKSSNVNEILSSRGSKRVTMRFVYGEVDAEKMTDGWNIGFKKHQTETQMAALRERLERFNTFFADAHEGDLIVFDFLADGSTATTIKGKLKGKIDGADFQQALLLVWLGNKPADDDLKEAMLGR